MVYIKQLKLKNIRGFRELNLDLSNGEQNARMKTLIIGKNGTGKTTLLRCITLGLCDPADGNSLIAEPIGRLVAENSKTAQISIELCSNKKIQKSYNIDTKLMSMPDKEIVNSQSQTDMGKNLFVCGYGAGRSTYERSEGFREYRIIDSAYSLFQYETGMTNTELTLRRLRDFVGEKRYDETMKGIKKVLNLSSKDQINLPKGGGVEISGPSIGKNIPLEGWADGYRITFNWIMDVYAWAMRANNVTSSGGIEGILLIDELEQHIHPAMQADILPRLSYLFPDLQIIATTHSPLLLLGAASNEIISLKRKRKNIYKEESIPNFKGYSAEDILVDDRLFDTGAYSTETNEKLLKHRRLVNIPKVKRTNKQVEKMKSLARDLQSQQLPEVRESPLIEELKKFSKKFDL